MFKDSIENLERAIKYLRAPQSGELYKMKTAKSIERRRARNKRIRAQGILMKRRSRLIWEPSE